MTSTREISRTCLKEERNTGRAKLDFTITIVPFLLVAGMCLLFALFPVTANALLGSVRSGINRWFGPWILIFGFGFFALSLLFSVTPIGSIRLGGQKEKPQYSFFSWGAMMFTTGLAADVLFYSFAEWLLYMPEPHIQRLRNPFLWASAYSLFHWGFIPWCFYLVLAVFFGFMIHVKKRERQRYSEVCRPILGKHTDGIPGRIIDIFAIFALLSGITTTFTAATPLLSLAIVRILPLPLTERELAMLILLITLAVYSVAVLRGMKGISLLSKLCLILFYGLLLYVFFGSGEIPFILRQSVESLGMLVIHFIPMSVDMPTKADQFSADWTIFFWAFWMVWSIAVPFFIGSISRGRTVRQVILGGYLFGVTSTFLSFFIFSNYSIGLQALGRADILQFYQRSGDIYEAILLILSMLPHPKLVMLLLIASMICFYATSFDSVALVAAEYSYHSLPEGTEPSQGIRVFWAILLISLPMALLFSESSFQSLQTVTLMAAIPLSFIFCLMTAAFLKDAAGSRLPGKH